MSLQKLSLRMVLLLFFLVVGVGLLFYLIPGRGANTVITNQMTGKQLILARAQASNISSFFKVFGDSVAYIAQLNSIKYRNENSLYNLETFVEQWKPNDLIGGIVLTDSKGVVEQNANILGTTDVGVNLSDREYFIWAKEQKDSGVYYIGLPVISRTGESKGKTIIPVVSPVIRDGVFTGVVVASVKIDNLTRHFLDIMKISDETGMFLVDDGGNLLYSNNESGVVGKNLFDYFNQNPFQGSTELINELGNALDATGEGNSKINYFDSTKNENVSRLIAYSPVELGNQSWVLVLSSPYEEVEKEIIPVYYRLLALMLMVLVSTFLFARVYNRI